MTSETFKKWLTSSSTIYLLKTVDMGITQNLKTLYHRNLVNYILEATEENLAISPTAREVSARVHILQRIQFVTDSWQ